MAIGCILGKSSQIGGGGGTPYENMLIFLDHIYMFGDSTKIC